MDLLQPTFLFAMAAIAVPITLHLVFRRPTRIVKLGSVRFLSELMRETANRRKLRRWLLLALRCGCLALLALLFARPFVRAAHESDAERLVVLLIDQSASMSQRQDGVRLIDAALAEANELIASLDEETTLHAAFFDTDVFPVNHEQTARPTLRAPERLFGATSYVAAFTWARDWCTQSRPSNAEVHILTDLQLSGLDWGDAEPLPIGVAVHVHDMAERTANNLAILSVETSADVVRPGDAAAVTATLFNYGQFEFSDVGVGLTLSSDGRQIHSEQRVSVPAGEAADVEFSLSQVPTGRWEGTVDVDGQDGYSFDNRRHLAMLSRPQSRVVIVDGSDDAEGLESGVFFLSRAIALARPGAVWERSPFVSEVVRYAAGEPLPSLGDVQICVLVDCPPDAPDAVRLLQFVERGGALILFTGERTTGEALEPLGDVGLLPGQMEGIRRTNDLPFRLGWWDAAHPVFAPFADPQQGDLSQFAFSAFSLCEPARDAAVLATFASPDRPAVVERAVGEGRLIAVLSTAGREWNSATRGRLFVPFVHQMLRDCVGLSGNGPVQRFTLDEWRAQRHESAERVAKQTQWPARPGVVASGDRMYVLSIAESESDPQRCAASDLGAVEASQAPANGSVENDAPTASGLAGHLASRPDESWPWLVLVLAGLLLLESFVANRTTM